MPRKKKKPQGYEQANMGDGFLDNQDELDTESENGGKEFFFVSDALDRLTEKLSTQGYHLKPLVNGEYCGFGVYKLEPLQVEGLNPPENFKYYRRVTPNTGDHREFLDTVSATCRFLAETAETTFQVNQYWAVAQSFKDCLADNRSNVFKATQSKSRQGLTPTSLRGTSGGYKVVPQLAWFPKNIQEFDPEVLLGIFPPAERDTLKLILGRIMVGATDTQAMEGVVSHGARSFAILVGEARIGKSYLMKMVKGAVTTLGYVVTTIPLGSKFGWGKCAVSDLAYEDDLHSSAQQQLLSDRTVKTVVSSGVIKTEEKGIAAEDVKAITVLMACSNEQNAKHFLNMDAGNADRANLLGCYHHAELEDTHGCKMDTFRVFNRLSEQLGVSHQLLTMRLLQHCAEYFLEMTGLSFSEHYNINEMDESKTEVFYRLEKDLTKDVLLPHIDSNRELYRLKTSLNHAEEVTQIIARLCALAVAISDESVRESHTNKLLSADFSVKMLRKFVEYAVDVVGTDEPAKNPDYAEYYPKYVSQASKTFVEAKRDDFDKLPASVGIDRAVTCLVEQLVAADVGFAYPKSYKFYQTGWTEVRSLLHIRIKEAIQLHQANPLKTGSLYDAVVEIEKDLRKGRL